MCESCSSSASFLFSSVISCSKLFWSSWTWLISASCCDVTCFFTSDSRFARRHINSVKTLSLSSTALAPSLLSPCPGFSAEWFVDSPRALSASQSFLPQLTLCCGLYVHPLNTKHIWTADHHRRKSSATHHDESRCSPGASSRAPPACVSLMRNEAGGVPHSKRPNAAEHLRAFGFLPVQKSQATSV